MNNGYNILSQVIDKSLLKSLQLAIGKNIDLPTAYGIRDLHLKVPVVDELVNSQLILDLLKTYTKQQKFQIVKSIFFNKNLSLNWSVGWHQDKTIAVNRQVSLPNYQNWTIKQGVPHVQPPLNILESITTLRIALDDTNMNNGALKIIPRSHRLGVLQPTEIEDLVQKQPSQVCCLQAGDILLMSPLLLHSSSKSIQDCDRRTIHLEYSSCSLPPELAWHGCSPDNS